MNVRTYPMTVALVLLLAACGSGDGGEARAVAETVSSTSTTAAPTPPPTSSTTVAETTSTTSSSTTTTATQPRCTPSPVEESLGASTGEGEALPGGCYSVERWGRTFEIEVSQPVTYFDFPYTFGVGDEDPGRSIVLLAEFTGVIPSEKVGTHPPHDDPIGEHVIDVPLDLATWISAAPQIVVTASGEYSIDGDPATWWDVEVDPSAGETFACPFGACVATLVPSPPDARGTNFVMGDAARFRVVQLSGSGTGLFMWVQGSPDGFDEAVALADSIAETLRLAG